MSRVRKTRIFNYLKEHPMASAKEVMGAVGCSVAAVCYTRQKMGIPSTILGRRKKYGTATPTSAPKSKKTPAPPTTGWPPQRCAPR